VLETQFNDDDANKAAAQVQAVIGRVPDLAGVFGANLFSATGTANGVKQAGKAGKVKPGAPGLDASRRGRARSRTTYDRRVGRGQASFPPRIDEAAFPARSAAGSATLRGIDARACEATLHFGGRDAVKAMVDPFELWRLAWANALSRVSTGLPISSRAPLSRESRLFPSPCRFWDAFGSTSRQ